MKPSRGRVGSPYHIACREVDLGKIEVLSPRSGPEDQPASLVTPSASAPASLVTSSRAAIGHTVLHSLQPQQCALLALAYRRPSPVHAIGALCPVPSRTRCSRPFAEIGHEDVACHAVRRGTRPVEREHAAVWREARGNGVVDLDRPDDAALVGIDHSEVSSPPRRPTRRTSRCPSPDQSSGATQLPSPAPKRRRARAVPWMPTPSPRSRPCRRYQPYATDWPSGDTTEARRTRSIAPSYPCWSVDDWCPLPDHEWRDRQSPSR